LFDKLIIAVGYNSDKKGLTDPETRVTTIRALFATHHNVSVEKYEGLTIDFCHHVGARYIVRGIRNTIDFEYEKSFDHMNKMLDSGIETLFFISSPTHAAVSSSALRDLIRNNHDISEFIPYDIS
jgi:pantetheine-phosphate adenylyltransferase